MAAIPPESYSPFVGNKPQGAQRTPRGTANPADEKAHFQAQSPSQAKSPSQAENPGKNQRPEHSLTLQTLSTVTGLLVGESEAFAQAVYGAQADNSRSQQNAPETDRASGQAPRPLLPGSQIDLKA